MTTLTYVVNRPPAVAKKKIKENGKLKKVVIEGYTRDSSSLVVVTVGFEDISDVTNVLHEIFTQKDVMLLSGEHVVNALPRAEASLLNWRFLPTT